MNNQYLENNYRIKLIMTSSDSDYANSVKIYSRVTPSDIRTNTNELTYWLDHNSIGFKSYFFSLFLNDRNIGLAMCTYLSSVKTVVIEYSPKADDMAKKIEEMANKMLQEGYELVTMSITGTAKAILVFRMQ